MTSTGVRDLKDRLSHYLRLVERGESVLVTDHGRVVAELRPADRALARRPVAFAALQEAGAVQRPAVRGDPLAHWPTRAVRLAAGTAQRLINQDRGP